MRTKHTAIRIPVALLDRFKRIQDVHEEAHSWKITLSGLIVQGLSNELKRLEDELRIED